MRFLPIIFFLFTITCSAQLTKYVNPFIGTGGTGHTFPGATTPFAMVQLSPDTRIDGSWEGCSGYHYNDSIIYGFSHTHLSGTGCSDYGDIAFMPYFSKNEIIKKLKTENVQAKFFHRNEKASAGYYSVVLDDIPVKVELTATTRTGFQRYTFNENGYGYIVLNLKHRDELLEGKMNLAQMDTITSFSGLRRSKAWAKNQELYFGFHIDKVHSNQFVVYDGENIAKLVLEYKVKKGETIQIKTGISTVDENAALNNMYKEIPSWNFNKVKQQAQQVWEKELNKIEVFDKNETNKNIFYTAMYHCMIHPSIMNDVDGRYKGRDGKIHTAEGFNYYTVFSLWDTHRALHPLLNIIDKKRSHDFVITFLKQFEQSGRLPMWELWNNETDCMIGFHSVSVILDAYRKQVITKAELQQLWPAVKAEAMSNRFGLDKFREKGFLSVEDESESVSKTAEYSYDMWCVSQIAKELTLTNEKKYFLEYTSAELELYNPETGFIQPRKNGNWVPNFNPYEVNNNYTEANAWQYSFYHPQDNNVNEKMLDSLFKAIPKTQGREQADITGLIGQYAQGNEPSHNYIYLLKNPNRVKQLKYVFDNFYTNKPDGLIGNEDCGQMSAWYVMSALGFYQACPGADNVRLGYPLFGNVKLNIDNGSTSFFKIKKGDNDNLVDFKNGDFNANYVTINNQFKLTEILKKPKNYFIIGSKQMKNIGLCNGYGYNVIESAPLIVGEINNPFADSLKIIIKNVLEFYEDSNYSSKFYQIDNANFAKYKSPFYIKKSSKITAYNVYGDDVAIKLDTSNLSIAHFNKRPHNYSIQLNCKYNRQYTADGDDGIIDGQYGDKDFRKGGWQGYQAQDFEAIIDMKETKQFAEISANFLQDSRSWILFPTKVEFYTSDDNINFKLAETIENTRSPQDYNVQTQKLKVKTQKEFSTARYIKVKAYNYGKLPEWHAGKGDDAFIFIDEIEIK
jgi:predicted alpha-1,2-mannosidase